jgi:hypothetical protein
MFDRLKDFLTNPLDIETAGESNKEPHATFRSISSSNEFAIQEGLVWSVVPLPEIVQLLDSFPWVET